MAYSADSFVADEQPTTAKWNKLWNNDASFNDGTGLGDTTVTHEKQKSTVSFRATTTQTVAAGVVDITTYSEVTDRGGNFNPATGLFTVPYNGDYHLSGAMSQTDQTGRMYMAFIASTSGTVLDVMDYNGVANGEITAKGSVTCALVAGETVKIQINNQAGASVALARSFFSGHIVGRV